MRIIGPPTLDHRQLGLAVTKTLNIAPLFMAEMFEPLWVAAAEYFIDPVGMVAQALHETGLGHYTGKVQPHHFNTAGIKIYDQRMYPETMGDNPLAHQIFPNWWVGARAHAQHLCAYAGIAIAPQDLVDPRYVFVYNRHKLEQWSELGGLGRWAPDSGYGDLIEREMMRLQVLGRE